MIPEATVRCPVVLDEPVWQSRKAAHEKRVDAWLVQIRPGKTHPVYDFLFTYYTLRQSKLREWHPGYGTLCAGPAAESLLDHKHYRAFAKGTGLDAPPLVEKRRQTLTFILRLLQASAARPAFFGCSGLHEWAMVYHQDPSEVRHASFPLRMAPDRLANFVESQPIVCSHYDAFRFFTPAARPLNRLQPHANSRVDMEQTGCLHTNMDLYKWASKLIPLISSEILADAFEVAIEARKIDMRASPYDLSSLGFSAIRIETPEGRAEYECEQKRIRELAAPVRAAMIHWLQRVLDS